MEKAREVGNLLKRPIKRQVADDGTCESFDLAMQRFLVCTKFQHWSYEEEIRVLISLDRTVQEGSGSFYNFDGKLALAEVILGSECRVSLAAMRQLAGANFIQMQWPTVRVLRTNGTA